MKVARSKGLGAQMEEVDFVVGIESNAPMVEAYLTVVEHCVRFGDVMLKAFARKRSRR